MCDSIADNVRRATIRLLELLADLNQQRAYERNVPIADVPAELVCGWFDDLYHPDDGVHAEAFSPAESQVLARFHAYFEERVDILPQEGGVTALHASPEWREVARFAAKTLKKLKRL